MARKKKETKLICGTCNKELKLGEFYKIPTKYHNRANRSTHCKHCIKKTSYYGGDKAGRVDLKSFQTWLMKLDLPFLKNVYRSAVETKIETIGKYFNILTLPQYLDKLAWEHSYFVDDHEQNEIYKKKLMDEITLLKNMDDDDKVEIIPGEWEYVTVLRDKWGKTYDVEELVELEKVYIKLDRYVLTENQMDEINLQDACKAKFLYDMEINTKGSAKNIERLRKNKDYAFKVLKTIEHGNDIPAVSLLLKKVDEVEGGLELLDKWTKYPRDQVDMLIYVIMKKSREHQGLSIDDLSVKDMAKFYDEMKEEYLEQLEDEERDDLMSRITI